MTGAVLDASTTTNAPDTGAALAFFNSRPGNVIAASYAAAGFGGNVGGEGEKTVALGARLPAGVYVARVRTASRAVAVPFMVGR